MLILHIMVIIILHKDKFPNKLLNKLKQIANNMIQVYKIMMVILLQCY